MAEDLGERNILQGHRQPDCDELNQHQELVEHQQRSPKLQDKHDLQSTQQQQGMLNIKDKEEDDTKETQLQQSQIIKLSGDQLAQKKHQQHQKQFDDTEQHQNKQHRGEIQQMQQQEQNPNSESSPSSTQFNHPPNTTKPPQLQPLNPFHQTASDSKTTFSNESSNKPSQSIVRRRLIELWVDLKVKEFIPVKILNFLLFGGMMSLFPFLTLQARSLGITESELGIMYAFLPITALFGPALAGMLADRIGNFKYFLAATMLASGFTALLYMLIPAGRIQHTLPDVLPLTLNCSSVLAPQLMLVDGLNCDFATGAEGVDVFMTSCQPQCDDDGQYRKDQIEAHSIVMDSPSIKLQYLNSQAYQLKTVESLTNALEKNSSGLPFDPANINRRSHTILLIQNDESTVTVGEEVCHDINRKISEWLLRTHDDVKSEAFASQDRTNASILEYFLSNTTSFLLNPSTDSQSFPRCFAECRLLVARESVCSNVFSTEDINPALTFWLYVLVRTLNALTLATSMPLFEGAVVAILKQYNGDFGFQRMYGSLGPLVMTPLSGLLIDKFSSLHNTEDYSPAFYLYFAIKLLCSAVVLMMDLEFKKPSEKVITDFKSLITTAEISVFLAMCFIAGVCFGAMDTFLFWLLEDMGASKSLMGLTLTVGNLCSLPILLFATPIIKKVGCVNTIIVGLLFFVVRFIGYSLIYNPWLCMPFEALECFTVALLVTAAITYSAELSTPTTTATLQGLMGGLKYGVGRGAGSLMGGFIMAAIGVRHMFHVMAGISFLAAACYFVLNRVFFRKAAMERKLKMKDERCAEKNMQVDNVTGDGALKLSCCKEKDNPAYEHDCQLNGNVHCKTDNKQSIS